MYQHWIDREISTGFQKLILLSLERTPASEVINGTVDAWHEAIIAGRVFDEARDAPRFKLAFLALAQRSTHWPSPREFLEAMPSLPSEPLVARLTNDESRQRGMQKIDEIYLQMGWTKPDEEVRHDSDAS